ncbi:MAG: glycogen synthase [Oscillospiraceae bacterium]|nr:glycogen synthase [Oscillospiraceae bacterium]
MKVLYITSEAKPFAASGGLGDVAGSLPAAITAKKTACRVVMPLYDAVPESLRAGMTFLTSFTVPVAWRRQYCGVFQAKIGATVYYLLDNQYYFKRAGLYGHYDDAERFAFFARAVLEMLPHIDYRPDILHANDWQTGLVPVYLSLFYSGNPSVAEYERYQNLKTVYTIHNIQYQGKYGRELLSDVFGIPEQSAGLVIHDECVNLMKGGIEAANWVTTVSPTYAKEILDPWYAHGLDGMLRAREWKLSGILNGIDTGDYNPETDPDLAANYSADSFSAGKAANKAALQKECGLPVNPDVPLIGMVTRLVSHKGLDLVKYAIPDLLADDLQILVLGAGDWAFESFFREAKERWPDKFCFYEGFHPAIARRVYAGSDIFLMPSKSEPCGLAQMVACRYGTLPVVRETGGLKDSITDCGEDFSRGEGGVGFTFKTYNAGDMLHAVYRAAGAWHNKTDWPQLVARAMRADFSWGKSALEYIRLYRALLK